MVVVRMISYRAKAMNCGVSDNAWQERSIHRTSGPQVGICATVLLLCFYMI